MGVINWRGSSDLKGRLQWRNHGVVKGVVPPSFSPRAKYKKVHSYALRRDRTRKNDLSLSFLCEGGLSFIYLYRGV